MLYCTLHGESAIPATVTTREQHARKNLPDNGATKLGIHWILDALLQQRGWMSAKPYGRHNLPSYHARKNYAKPFLFLGERCGIRTQAPAFPLWKDGLQPCLDLAPLASRSFGQDGMLRNGRSSTQTSAANLAIGSTTAATLIAIEPYSHSRHASMYFSLPTATTLAQVVHAGWGPCIRSMRC